MTDSSVMTDSLIDLDSIPKSLKDMKLKEWLEFCEVDLAACGIIYLKNSRTMTFEWVPEKNIDTQPFPFRFWMFSEMTDEATIKAPMIQAAYKARESDPMGLLVGMVGSSPKRAVSLRLLRQNGASEAELEPYLPKNAVDRLIYKEIDNIMVGGIS
jgi:hypothetical protein